LRVFAFSDLHVDYAQNLACVQALSRSAYRRDVLLLGGDVSDDLTLLGATLAGLRERFARVFFVPGNHELWDRTRSFSDALARFEAVLALAHAHAVDTAPACIGPPHRHRWIVPLFSWYRRREDGADSLFVAKDSERLAHGWSDDRFVRWPPRMAQPPADYFLALNEPHIRSYPQPVISFSHFLPRRRLMFAQPQERRGRRLGDPHPAFNFSRVAGCRRLDEQIRRLGSTLHVYGHQHRNRARLIDGVRYVSHCLGYPRERQRGYLPADAAQPRCVWDSESGLD